MKTFYALRAFLALIAVYVLFLLSSMGYAMHKVNESYMYKCSDFESQRDAQSKFNTGKYQYSRLDGNLDGVACNNKK